MLGLDGDGAGHALPAGGAVQLAEEAERAGLGEGDAAAVAGGDVAGVELTAVRGCGVGRATG